MGKTALIVDDSKTARAVLQKMLETHDLVVDNAGSAESALSYLSENRPDIIFMDHEMPGMDGFEAVSAIKKNPATATIPIMMYTAQEGELYVGQARALGAVGVLPKEVEPVELSKVLESLRVIGEDAERREHYDETGDDYVSGEYPSLAKFDQDLGVLIQELFDQQRSILRRDLRDSQVSIAARVVDEIKSPDADLGGIKSKAEGLKKYLPDPLHGLIAALSIISLVVAGLYWKREQTIKDIEEQNFTLRQALGQQRTVETEGAVQTERQLADYQLALEDANTVALRSIEWAMNKVSHYDFDEFPFGDARRSLIIELHDQLAALGFEGSVRIESHVGNFCMTSSGPDGYALADPDLPATQCDRIGFDAAEAYDLGLRQSVAFANFIAMAELQSGGKIRYEIVSQGNSAPSMTYPAPSNGILASDWNQIASNNNRVDITLLPGTR